MAQKGANIKITADTKNAEKGIEKVSSELNKFQKKLSKNSTANFVTSLTGVTKAFGFVTSAVKSAVAAVNDTIDAYNKQAQAEVQLEAAARNNPYLNAANVQSLKDYASQLQSMSTFGDEELLPLMAQLASAGRTQAEIQDIMSASVDIAASGTMSLESAVKNLSKTYSGLSGELGEANPAIKSLTTEQLKSGEAVKVMKQQYSGIAKSVADATGGWKQFENTLGDLKEVIGKDFADTKNSAGKILNAFLSNVVSGLSSASKEAEEFKKKISAIASAESGDVGGIKDAKSILEQENKEYEEGIKALTMTQEQFTSDQAKAVSDFKNEISRTFLNDDGTEEIVKGYDAVLSRLTDIRTKAYNRLNGGQTDHSIPGSLARDKLAYDNAVEDLDVFENQYKSQLDTLNKNVEDAGKHYKEVRKKYVMDTEETLRERIEKNNKSIEDYNKQLEKAAENSSTPGVSEADQKALDAKAKYAKTMSEFDAQQERERYLAEKTGEAYDETAAAVSRLSAMTSAYFTARKEAGSTISDSNSWTKSTIKDITAQTQKVKELKGAAKDAGDAAEDAGEKFSDWYDKEVMDAYQSDIDSVMNDAALSIKEQIELLEKLKEEWSGNADAVGEIDNALQTLKASMTDWDKMTGMDRFEALEEQGQKLASSIQSAFSLAAEYMDDSLSAELSSLELQFNKGLMSEEEYNEQKEKLEKDAARKKYRIQLAEWGMNLLATQSSQALAIAKALASGTPPLNYIEAAVTGAAAAVQLAAQIAAKPIPPSYATGGVVGGFSGASVGGDNTYIHARNGEMMLNAAQQRNLFDFANSKGQGGNGALNVEIKNYKGNDTGVSAQMDNGTLKFIVDSIVKDSMGSGEYNSSLRSAQNTMQGVKYTS